MKTAKTIYHLLPGIEITSYNEEGRSWSRPPFGEVLAAQEKDEDRGRRRIWAEIQVSFFANN